MSICCAVLGVDVQRGHTVPMHPPFWIDGGSDYPMWGVHLHHEYMNTWVHVSTPTCRDVWSTAWMTVGSTAYLTECMGAWWHSGTWICPSPHVYTPIHADMNAWRDVIMMCWVHVDMCACSVSIMQAWCSEHEHRYTITPTFHIPSPFPSPSIYR